MGFSCRIFLLDERDGLYRLANMRYAKMLRDPQAHPLPLFAGQRVRMAGASVQLIDRMPMRLVRLTFGFLRFDKEGRFDSNAFQQQQFARFESKFAPAIAADKRNSMIVDGFSTRACVAFASWALPIWQAVADFEGVAHRWLSRV